MYEFKGLCLLWAAATSGHISLFHCYANGLRYMNNKPGPPSALPTSSRPGRAHNLLTSRAGRERAGSPRKCKRWSYANLPQPKAGTGNGLEAETETETERAPQGKFPLSASCAFSSSRKCLKRHCQCCHHLRLRLNPLRCN